MASTPGATARTAKAPPVLLAAALLLCGSGPARADEPGAAAPDAAPPDLSALDLRLDAAAAGPRPGAQRRLGRSARRSLAASLPDPRALKGLDREHEALRLRLNLEGFSVLDLGGSAADRFTLRRIREREWRRPALSVTIQKRF